MGIGQKDEKTVNAKNFVRILPCHNFCHDAIKIERDRKILHVQCLQDFSKAHRGTERNYWCFPTDGIFWDSSQEEIYGKVADGLVENLLSGTDSMIVAYGQTGSGKTYTTSGLRYQFENRGIALRLLTQLFEEQSKRIDTQKICCSMSYVELIGETLRDLLYHDKYPNAVSNEKFVSKIPLESEPMSWKMIFDAEARKSFDESAPYPWSNRGHSIMTIYVEMESLVDSDPVVTHAKIHLIDLGGIDYFGNSSSYWKTKEDIKSSNLSKTLLEHFILGLNGKSLKMKANASPPKFSKLIGYLHDTLRPYCLLRFIGHVYGTLPNLPITLSVLRFGARICCLDAARLNRHVEPNCILNMRALQKEVERLKTELELNEMIRDSANYYNISQENLQQIKRAARGFLQSKLESLTLLSLNQGNVTVEVFKELYDRLVTEKEQAVKDAIIAATEDIQAQMTQPSGSSTSIQSKIPKRRANKKDEPQTASTATESAASTARPPTSLTQVGVLDRRGIGIGPGRTYSGIEGNATKAIRKLRSKKSDVLVAKATRSMSFRDKEVPYSKPQHIAESGNGLPATMPSREVAWREFVSSSNRRVREMLENVEKLEAKARLLQKNYMSTIAELARTRQELHNYRTDLEDCQHIQQIYGKSILDGEEQITSGDLGKGLGEFIERKERAVNEFLEAAHLAVAEFKITCNELLDARKFLETEFELFCGERYKTWIAPPEEPVTPEFSSMQLLTASVASQKEITCDTRPKLFLQLQCKMFHTVYVLPRKKWVRMF